MNWLLRTVFANWLRARLFLKKTLSKPAAVPGPLFLRGEKTPLPFMSGANLPWLCYGGDFGANAWSPDGGVGKPETRDTLQRIFSELNKRGIHTVRWFLLCDGRAGIRFNKAGMPSGVDPHLFADIDAALEIAAASQMRIIFVLIDFLWFGKATQLNGVQVGGHGSAIGSTYKQQVLRRRVLKPLLMRYGSSQVILAWDIINEPEWATNGYEEKVSGKALSFLTMRRFIKKTARLVHRHTRQLATVGLGNAAGLPLAMDTGLDFYQVHWYDRWNSVAPLDKPVPEWNLDRPLLLGEFPTRNSSRQPEAIIEASKKSGYCGALAWSIMGSDPSSGIGLDSEATG
ncbi:MAG: hypothetical protein NTZ12_01680 [Candidatus Aminicenantes bacterium]|nr:hypothetical protein [Candidatus Aminicenantes bacterium]